MTLYDDIYESAADNYGLITTAEAKVLGVANKDLTRFVKDGRLIRLGYGVYRIKHHVPEPNDRYAECVALVGSEAYLFGESVIAMHSLAPTNPSRIFVASPKRMRRHLSGEIQIVNRAKIADVTSYEGIPSQSIVEAIRSCKTTMMPKRLLSATKRAREEGLIRKSEESELLKELGAL